MYLDMSTLELGTMHTIRTVSFRLDTSDIHMTSLLATLVGITA